MHGLHGLATGLQVRIQAAVDGADLPDCMHGTCVDARCAASAAALTAAAMAPLQPLQVDLSQPKEAAAVKDQFGISLPEAGEISCSMQVRPSW